MTTRDFTANVISASKVVPDGNFKTSAASGVWDINEALDLIKGGNWPNAANLDPASFVDGLFQTHLYTGNSSTRTITNNIDLSGKGGLVWIKDRDSGSNAHLLYDTERGAYNALKSSSTAVNQTRSTGLTGFTSSGFTLGSLGAENGSSNNKVSWTFREQPKFFDIVTYTGDGNADRQIDHNLGSTPGMMIVKKYAGSTTRWAVYHRSLGTGKFLNLDDTAATVTQNDHWQTAPNATQFTVETNGNVNNSGDSYVAYLFAHNDDDGGFGEPGDQDIIKCGSYTGNASTQSITLGFEPQFIFLKSASSASNWVILDSMRGVVTSSSAADDKYLFPNSDTSEGGGIPMDFTTTGFDLANEDTSNKSGDTFVYMAIRRGGMQTPSTASDVFAINTTGTNDSPDNNFTVGFDPDLSLNTQTNGNQRYLVTRLLGNGTLKANDATVVNNISDASFFGNPSGTIDLNTNFWGTASNLISWSWKRARGYFDVCCYSGTGSARTQSHNLGAVPEMIWVKGRTQAENWAVYHKDVGATKYLQLNTTAAAATSSTRFNDTAPTSSVFSLGADNEVNMSGQTFVAYLFATVAGVSKVGSFSHTSGQTQNIDCGFSSGARFVLVKQYGSTGSWFLYDTTRGIVAGNDPRIKLDDTSAQNTSNDDIDPLSSGFTLTTNFSGGDYIFYAIA